MKRFFLVLLILAVAVFIFHSFLLESLASFLIVHDEVAPSDVIIVLGGDSTGERIGYGASLYKQGLAKFFLVSGGYLYWRVTYADLMRKHAQNLGVPGSAIIIEDKSESTMENAEFTLPIFKRRGFKSAILVTSPTHSRRAKRTFEKIFSPQGIKILSSPVKETKFSSKRWWRRHEDTQEVVLEYVKLIGYLLKGW